MPQPGTVSSQNSRFHLAMATTGAEVQHRVYHHASQHMAPAADMEELMMVDRQAAEDHTEDSVMQAAAPFHLEDQAVREDQAVQEDQAVRADLAGLEDPSEDQVVQEDPSAVQADPARLGSRATPVNGCLPRRGLQAARSSSATGCGSYACGVP